MQIDKANLLRTKGFIEVKVTDIQRVNSIDSTIEVLHGELQQLYKERSSLTSNTATPKKVRRNSSTSIASINLDDIDLSLDN